MINNKSRLLIILIILLAFFLRIYRINHFPNTLYGDEQAFAWNAYNILLTGQDEYGTSYPLQFRSFDDYKAPVPVYLLVPFIKVLGLEIFAVRLPIVITSVFAVLLTYLIARIFFRKKVSLFASFLMAISPWHVHLSRGFFESNLALTFFLAGIYFFLKSDSKIKQMFISMLFFALSIYSYFTPRIIVPLFLIFLFLFGIKFFNKNNYQNINKLAFKYLISLIFIILLCLPLIHATIFGKGFSRMNKLNESVQNTIVETVAKERFASNIRNDLRKYFHNKYSVYLRLVKNNYLEQLSLNFWYLNGDSSLRYFLGNMGMFYLFEMPFLVIGLYSLFKNKRKASIFLIGWIMLAPIPSSIAGKPFAVRSLAMLPAPFLIVGYGVGTVLNLIRRQSLKNVFLIILSSLVIFSQLFVLVRYYFEYPVYAATWWGWENKAAIDYALDREDEYEQIFISNYYTGAPLAYAVYTKQDPIKVRYALENPVKVADDRKFIKIGKYYFGSLHINKERLEQNIIPVNSLYIGRPDELDLGSSIKAPDDNRIIFNTYETK